MQRLVKQDNLQRTFDRTQRRTSESQSAWRSWELLAVLGVPGQGLWTNGRLHGAGGAGLFEGENAKAADDGGRASREELFIWCGGD